MTCATCGVAVGLRAPLVRVRGASIVVFCSTACLDGVPAPEPARAHVEIPPTPGPSAFEAPPPALPGPPPPLEPTPLEKTGRWPMSWKVAANLAGVSVAAALASLLWQAAPSRPEPAVASTEVAPPAFPPPPLHDRARAFLDEALASDDPDLSFQAAEALARLGRADALDRLRAVMRDPTDARRLRAARLLAWRADAEALVLLRARLDSRRREERSFAAQALALAGDAAGREGLIGLLSSPSTRLGAAEALAAIGDQRGLAALRRELGSRDAERRARAATALGRAGDPSAAGELRRVLAERRFEVGAALALAALDDPSVRPALVELLSRSALRADAAEALARMGGDPTPPPPSLEEALDHEPAPGRVQAALAILILAGEGR